MGDSIVTLQHPAENASDEMTAAQAKLTATIEGLDRQSQAYALPKVLGTNAAIMLPAEEHARRSRSIIGLTVDSFVAACSFIPYALVALVLRFVMARLFFLDGQPRIEGPRVLLNVQDFDFSVVLPLQVKVETIGAFLNQYSAIPISPVLGAYLLSYAEFMLPICLLVGFATRFAALGMLIIVALMQAYVAPEALWSLHVFWAAILLVLLTRGPGPISVDAIIRYARRQGIIPKGSPADADRPIFLPAFPSPAAR